MKLQRFTNNVIFLGIVVGLVSGIAAVILKSLIDLLEHWAKILHQHNTASIYFYFLPLIGIGLSVIITKFICGGKLEKGLSHVMLMIARKSSKIPLKHTYGHVLTSAVSIGFGGSAGLEAPIVFTGAAIGSNIAQQLNTDYTLRTLLAACGAAAGISAIFNAPIGGVIFAFEILLPQISVPYFIPLLIASATASVVSKFFYSGKLFSIAAGDWVMSAVPFYILLGVVCGIISIYIIKSTLYTENFFKKIPSRFLKIVLGGVALAVLIFLSVPLYGEGYTTIRILLQGNDAIGKISGGFLLDATNNNFLILIILTIFLKPFATAITNGSGGNGGIIAPSLLIGALTGFAFTQLLFASGIIALNTKNFVVAGMVGILSGVVHAPLSAIFIISELTGGYSLFIPFMLVSAVSYFISKRINKDSVYTQVLRNEGVNFHGSLSKGIIDKMDWDSILEHDFITLKPDVTLRKAIPEILKSRRSVFVVNNSLGEYTGLVYLDDIRETLSESDFLDIILVSEITRFDTPVIHFGSDLEAVMQLFEKEKYWQYPVVRDKKYVGMISRASFMNKVFNLEHEENELI